MRKAVILFTALLLGQGCLKAWAGGTNSTFLRMNNMVNELEKKEKLPPEEVKDWRDTIQALRKKVDERIRKNGGGMNQIQDQDLFGEINTEGKKLFELYQHSKKQSTH